MLLGFQLHKLRAQPRLNLSWVAVVWLWLAAVAAGLAVIYGTSGYQARWGRGSSTAERALYNGLHRLAWSLSLSWLIIACTKVGNNAASKKIFINAEGLGRPH